MPRASEKQHGAIVQYIWAFDPGGTTGIAVLSVSKNSIRYQRTEEAKEFPGDFKSMYRDILGCPLPITIVAETFRLYPTKAKAQSWNDFPSARIFGMLQWWASELHLPFVPQAPSVRKVMNLKAARHLLDGLFEFPKSKHMTDAIQHALYYYARSIK